jgi:hypothetical protein
MNGRSLTKAHMLLLAFVLAAQGTTAAASGQKGVTIPTLNIQAPGASVQTGLPNAAALPGANAQKQLFLPAPLLALPAFTTPNAPKSFAAQSAAKAAVGTPQAASANLAKIGEGVTAQVAGLSVPAASASDSSQAGHAIQTILQGGKAGPAASAVDGGSVGTPAASGLTPAGSGAANNGGGDKKGPEAPKASEPKPVESRMAYAYRRWVLNRVFNATGGLFSLPTAGPKLTASILKEAAYKDAVLSDIDDTLGKYNTILEKETVEGIIGMLAVGKTFAAITDRPDFARAGSSQLGALDSFSSVPETKRQGLIVATNGGGKIYEAQSDGQFKLIYEEPHLEAEVAKLVSGAANETVKQLAALGTDILDGDPKKGLNPGPYGFSMILKGGTPESVVKQVAHIFEAELKKAGLEFEVEGRMAKDPSLPPYATFSKLNKSLAVKRIAEIKKLEAERTILIGDSMYAPKQADKKDAKMLAWGEKMSGRAIPMTGNGTDRNMELGMPGALTIGVGGSADPRMSNAYVLGNKNAEGTRKVLNAVASTPRGAESGKAKAGRVATFLLLISMLVAGYGGIFYAIKNAPAAQQSQDYGDYPPGFNPNADWNDLFR